jgi:small subunit ribosomal protein S17
LEKTTSAKNNERNKRREIVGKVVSNKMNKTIVVMVSYSKKHKLYGKVLQRSKKFKAHDETNSCNIGDFVKLMETRPMSKEKRWRLVRIIERAK